MRRILLSLLFILVLLLLGAVAAFWWFTRPLPVLTVTTWPGPYGRAQASALMRPYAADNHIDVRIAQWDGDLNELARAVASHSYKGDVIDFELPMAIEACGKGLLEPIDADMLPDGADGTPARRDFVTNAIGPCWVGSVVYSQLIVFAPGKFADAPTRAADFFDLAKYPGPRALRRSSAKFNLELALLADGVAPGDVYKTLESDAGLARALARLATLKGNIVWWQAGSEAVAAVKSGRAVFATALNGDVFDAAQQGFVPGVIWDRQLYELDVFGVPKGDPNKDRAMDFIRFATGSAPLAGVANWVPYGPARRSALALVGTNPDLKIAMLPHLPTTPAHFQTPFAVDDAWWAKHAAAIAPRWQQFVDSHP